MQRSYVIPEDGIICMFSVDLKGLITPNIKCLINSWIPLNSGWDFNTAYEWHRLYGQEKIQKQLPLAMYQLKHAFCFLLFRNIKRWGGSQRKDVMMSGESRLWHVLQHISANIEAFPWSTGLFSGLWRGRMFLFFFLYLTARSQEADGGTDWVSFPINQHLLISGLLQKEYVLLPAWFADRRENWRKQRIVSLWFCKKRGWQARKRIIEVEEGKDIWETGTSAWGYSGYWDKSVRK